MSTKIGILEGPRIGVALLWLVPASPGEAHSTTAHVSPEADEYVRDLMGLGAEELMRRMRTLADRFAQDPAAVRAEILRLTDGDEIVAGHVIELIRSVTAPNAADDSDAAGGDNDNRGEVIEFQPSNAPSSDSVDGTSCDDDDDDGEPPR